MGECELRILLMMHVVDGLLRRLELSRQVGVHCCEGSDDSPVI